MPARERTHARGMLDTSTVILLGRLEGPADLPDESIVSVATLAQLSVGPHVALIAASAIAVLAVRVHPCLAGRCRVQL